MEHAVTTGSITLFGAFLAGLLSFLSPCVLPLTPAYVARLVGPAVWEGSQLERSAHARLRTVTLLHSTAFVAGFTAMFLALGATASALGSRIAGQQELLRHVGGLVLIVFGLYVAGLLRLPWLDREWRFTQRQGSGGGYPASFVVGLIFALGWTPCIGPILAGILLLAAQARTLGSGVLLLFVYSLGLSIPFLVLGLAFDRVAPLLKRLTPYLRVIEVGAVGAGRFVRIAILVTLRVCLTTT